MAVGSVALPVTVVGIAPPGFYGDRVESNPRSFWLPLASEPTLEPANSLVNDPSLDWLDLIGRVKPGADQKADFSRRGLYVIGRGPDTDRKLKDASALGTGQLWGTVEQHLFGVVEDFHTGHGRLVPRESEASRSVEHS